MTTAPRRVRHSASVPGRWEASLTQQLLPGCPACGHAHPLAVNPHTADPETCPGCGGPAAEPGEAVCADVGGGPWLWLANLMNAIARALLRLSERFKR